MTTIAVKDGVLAVDSACSDSGVTIGAVTKYAEVPDFHGGGVAAACGSSAARWNHGVSNRGWASSS